MRRSSNSNSTTFELRMFSTDSKFQECLSALLWNATSWKNPCSATDFIYVYRVHRQPESAGKLFFRNSTYGGPNSYLLRPPQGRINHSGRGIPYAHTRTQNFLSGVHFSSPKKLTTFFSRQRYVQHSVVKFGS